jgi:hypothetical protein
MPAKNHSANRQPYSSDAIRTELIRLEGKEGEFAQTTITAKATADECEQHYFELAYRADANGDAEAAAACEAAQDRADTARREQRRAESNLRKCRAEIAQLRLTLDSTRKREANEQNADDFERIVLPLAREADQHVGPLFEVIQKLVAALGVCAGRLNDAEMPDVANSFLQSRLRSMRDVLLWAQSSTRFTGRRAPRPLTHTMQGVGFEAALSGRLLTPIESDGDEPALALDLSSIHDAPQLAQ